MSGKAIDYRILLKRDGQTRQQRMPQWLPPSRVPVDARTREDFYRYLKALSSEINFYDADTFSPDGTWEEFFNLSEAELTKLASSASLPPHIALWQSFISIYQLSQDLANTITKRHLDFYYGNVLRLSKDPASPDQVHVVFELKKNTSDTLLPAGTYLHAGKDKTKKELRYRLTHDIVVNRSLVVSLRSIFRDPVNGNIIYHAPVANSADGVGAELDPGNANWSAFGSRQMPRAHVGFCFAAAILTMKEDERTITLSLGLKGLPDTVLNSHLTSDLFQISATGEKGWIGPKIASVSFSGRDNGEHHLKLVLTVGSDEPAITAYDSAVHGNSFETVHPVLQILLNNQKGDFGYSDLAAAELVDATIAVEVKGVKDLILENDFGALDREKPFAPFGSSPEINVNFSIGSVEAFSKRLKEFSVDVEWKNIPSSNLGNYFSGYGGSNTNADFRATAGFKDGFGWEEKANVVNLFNSSNAQSNTSWKFINPAFAVYSPLFKLPYLSVAPFHSAGQTVQEKTSSNLGFLSPAFASLKPVASSIKVGNVLSYHHFFTSMVNAYKDLRRGTLNLRLRRNFLFKEYRDKYTGEVLRFSREGGTLSLPAEPFAPEIQSLTLNYTATTAKTSFGGTTLNDFIDEEVEFYHYGAFGQKREHAFLRSRQAFLTGDQIPLMPEYSDEGSFFIGLSGLQANDAACILFQLSEGSANPDKPKVDIEWSVLCDNYWKTLGNENFIFDTTNDLLTSGVIKFVIPREATVSNTIMPTGLLWLRASIKGDSDAVCKLIDVQANAAISIFEDTGNDPHHLASPLSAGSITRVDPEKGTLKSVTQPYASFGGHMQEDDDSFYVRVSERLRHKERSISNWDYERLILQHFPGVYKVKCINHASGSSFYAPGNVLIIAVPDLTNKNAVDPLRPRADKNTLDSILTFLQHHSSAWVSLHISNPYYEPVKVSVGIKLKTGFEFNYYQKIIDEHLQAFLSPWISNNDSESIHFGGKITESMIVGFLENMEFVDFITDLILYHSTDGGRTFQPKDMIETSNPAAVLVSHSKHEVSKY